MTDVFVRESDHINLLTIADEHGREQVLETTDGHPFWVVADNPDLSRAARSVVDENGVWLYHENIDPTEHGYWVEAKDLREGDIFLGANGELSTLVSKDRIQFAENVKVYNFSVDGNHDYFVLAEVGEFGQTCILVHNAGGVYALLDGEGNVVRTGRTKDLLRRAKEHKSDPNFKKYDFKELHQTDVYAEQRGLEQAVHDLYNPPLNKINPISPSNPNRPTYIKAAIDYLGR